MEKKSRGDLDSNPEEVVVAGPPEPAVEEEEGPGKLPLAEKMDMTMQRYCSFTLMDTVEDGVRVRLLNVWAFLLVYIFFVFGLLRISEKLAPEVAVLEVSTPMSHFTYTGGRLARPIKDDVPDVTPKVGLFDNYGNAVRNATCELVVTDFTPIGPLPCSASELRAGAGTLHARRYIDTCNYRDVKGTTAAPASGLGLAPFEDLAIQGPAGLYTFAVHHGNLTSTTVQKSTVSTPVASLVVVDPIDLTARLSAPVNATVGQPLLKQPAVLLRDANGLPVANRVVTVFVNPEPTWPGGTLHHPPPDFGQRGQKFADLSCATSEPSDEQGVAKFTCLGVLGTTVDHVYFVFSESGFVFKPWNDPVDSPGTLYPFGDDDLRYYRYPTRIITSVWSVQATNAAYEHGIKEGIPLSPSPTVRTLDEQGRPVPGRWCYAIVTASSGQYLPLYFRRSRLGHRQKELLNAIAKTDSNGIATFSNLSVSVYGNALYDEGVRESNDTSLHIGFVCDGKFPADPTPWSQASGGFIPSVQTRVASVVIQRFTTDSAYVTSLDSSKSPDPSTVFVAVVRVLDADGRGVAGKTVMVQTTTDTHGFVHNAVVQQEPTSDSGFAVVSFTMAVAPPDIKAIGHAAFRVKFVVDGVASEDSRDLTARLNGDYQPSACHLLMFTNVAMYDSFTGETHSFNALEQVPEAMSGSVFAFNVFMIGQTVDTCVHYPELVHGGPDSVNMSGCPFVAFASGGSRRALSGSRGMEPGALRRLAERRSGEDGITAGAAPHRRLSSSADGTVTLEVLSAYSDDGVEHCDALGHCEFVVKNEPRHLLNVTLEGEQYPPPTLEAMSAEPTFFVAAGTVAGPQGDHFIKLKVTLRASNTSAPQTCYSPPLNIRLKNRLATMEVEGDALEPYAKKITHNEALDIKVKLVPQDPDTMEPTAPSDMPPFHLATSNTLDMNQVYWKFIQYPEMWNWQFALRGAQKLPPENPTDIYRLEQAVDAWDASSGTLALQFAILQPGLFGRFALIFGAAGLWSRVFTFEVVAPPLISLEVLQTPGFGGAAELSTQTYLPEQPAVKVTVGGQPLVGAVLAAEVVPEEGSLFARLTDIPAWSVLPLIYSDPADTEGIARWQWLAVLDGRGCARFKFMLIPGELETSPTPTEPLCFRPAYSFQIKSFPPATLPVGAPLSSIGGIPPLTVEARVDGEVPSLLCPLADPSAQTDPVIRAHCNHVGFGFVAMRVMVSEAAGEQLNRVESVAATRSMLQNSVCLWIQGKEPLGRCSDLEFVQWEPFVIVRFQIQRLTWARVTKSPAQIKLMISDLSASGFDREEPMPAGFLASSPLEQMQICMDTMMKVSSETDLFTTGTIEAESKPASAAVVLSPPKVVTMGKMFLVRLQLLTKYGSPVPGKAIRVCIAKPSSLTPGIASPSFLQALGVGGFTLGSACDEVAKLDPMGTVRISRADGTVSFPLTVETGRSGSYKLLFQPEEPGASILAESVVFRLFNPITAVSAVDEPWGTIRVAAFGKQVQVPRTPIFRVQTSGGETLDELEGGGVRVKLRLELKGVSEAKLKARAKLMEIRKQAAKAAIEVAQDKLSAAVRAASAALADIAPDLLQAAQRTTAGIFANFAPDFHEACSSTPVASMGDGDPAKPNATEVQEASMSDEVALDPSIIGPVEQLSQFIYTMTSGGAEMKSAEMMQPLLSIELGYNALVPVEDPNAAENTTAAANWTVYTLKDQLFMNFQPGFQYQLVLSANGVTGTPEEFPPFTVEEEPLPPEERAFGWFVGSLSVVLAAVVLVTNTRTHHYRWCVVAILFCLGVVIAVPYLQEFKMALGGYWAIVAYVDLIIMMAALVWSLGLEVAPQRFGLTFQERRMAVYEEYVKMRFSELLFEVEVPEPTFKESVVAMLKPFSSQHAFYFPSNLLAAGVLGFGSFLYILWQTIAFVESMEAALNAMLNRAIGAILRKVASINERVYANLGRDLPDSATDFLYSQLDLIEGWFAHLIGAIYVGVWIGIVIAFLVTLGTMFFTFYDFRRRALELRRGRHHLGEMHVQVGYSASFIGVFISSTVIGFALIVLVVTLMCLPFAWPVLFNIIWSYRIIILITLLPYLIKPLGTALFKLCAFGPDFFRNRALASFYFFYQTYASIAGGVFGAFVRFGMGLVGLIVMVPCIAGPNVSVQAAKLGLKDSSHTTYLSAVLTYHLHNAPIFAVAARRLLRICEAKRAAKESGRPWPSSKCLVLLLLLRFPGLRQYRKTALADAAQQAEEKAKKREELAKVHASLRETATSGRPRPMHLAAASGGRGGGADASPQSARVTL